MAGRTFNPTGSGLITPNIHHEAELESKRQVSRPPAPDEEPSPTTSCSLAAAQGAETQDFQEFIAENETAVMHLQSAEELERLKAEEDSSGLQCWPGLWHREPGRVHPGGAPSCPGRAVPGPHCPHSHPGSAAPGLLRAVFLRELGPPDALGREQPILFEQWPPGLLPGGSRGQVLGVKGEAWDGRRPTPPSLGRKRI